MTASASIRESILIPECELSRFHAGPTVADRAHALLLHQQATWQPAARGYQGLDSVQARTLQLDGLTVRVQHNPARMKSSAARVNQRAATVRPCLLCASNLPKGQRALAYGEHYLILVNPFPIAPEHFTVPAAVHSPQRIRGAVSDLLALARHLAPRYTVFYNGPECGASAPDHLHFQAVTAGFMPLDQDLAELQDRHGVSLGERDGVRITGLGRLPCRCVVLEADTPEPLQVALCHLLRLLVDLVPGEAEPMVNLIVRYQQGWRVVVIPRARHRPSMYADDGKNGILLSPASVDLGGVFITPRAEDYRKLQLEDLRLIFSEVCLQPDRLFTLQERLRAGL